MKEKYFVVNFDTEVWEICPS